MNTKHKGMLDIMVGAEISARGDALLIIRRKNTARFGIRAQSIVQGLGSASGTAQDRYYKSVFANIQDFSNPFE